jgi:peptidoglycan hydrolase CwlO-like protein
MKMEQLFEMLKEMKADKEEMETNREKDKDFMAKLDANQEKADADRKAWREKIPIETEAIKARTKAIQENMGTSHKEMVAKTKPERHGDDGLLRNDGGASRRARADLSGHETCGGRTRGTSRRHHSDAGQRT